MHNLHMTLVGNIFESQSSDASLREFPDNNRNIQPLINLPQRRPQQSVSKSNSIAPEKLFQRYCALNQLWSSLSVGSNCAKI